MARHVAEVKRNVAVGKKTRRKPVPDEEFVARLKELAAECDPRRATMAALAERVGLPARTVSDYARGVEPTRPALIKIASAMGVSLEWLVAGRGEKEAPPLEHRRLAYAYAAAAERIRAALREEGKASNDAAWAAEIMKAYIENWKATSGRERNTRAQHLQTEPEKQ